MIILLDPDPVDGGYVPPKSTTPKMVTVQQAKEPPKEVLEQEFKIDKSIFNHDSNEGTVTVEDKSGNSTPAKMVEKTEDKAVKTGVLKAPVEKKVEEPIKKVEPAKKVEEKPKVEHK